MIKSAAITAVAQYGFDTANDPIDSWLEEGKNQVEIAYDWPFLQTIATISVALGVNTIALPSDFFKVQSIRDTTNKVKLEYKDIVGFERDIDDPTDAGQPVLYTETALGTLQLYPVPDTQVSMRVVYQNALTDISALASGATLPGPSRFHYLYVLGAAYHGLMADNEEDRAVTAQAMFEAGISRLIRKYAAPLDASESVVDVMGYNS